MRLLLAALLFAATLAPAQTPHNKSPETLRAEARALLAAEKAKAEAEDKNPPCNDEHFGQADLNLCFFHNAQRMDQSYLKFVRLLGTILRADAHDAKTKDRDLAPLGAGPFDAAEAAWQTYRTKFCEAFGHQYEGGSMQVSACHSGLTFTHIKELGDFYSDDLDP